MNNTADRSRGTLTGSGNTFGMGLGGGIASGEGGPDITISYEGWGCSWGHRHVDVMDANLRVRYFGGGAAFVAFGAVSL